MKNALKNKNVLPPVALPPFKSKSATTNWTINPPINQHPSNGNASCVTLPDNKAKKQKHAIANATKPAGVGFDHSLI